jgi:hypothetical protein
MIGFIGQASSLNVGPLLLAVFRCFVAVIGSLVSRAG